MKNIMILLHLFAAIVPRTLPALLALHAAVAFNAQAQDAPGLAEGAAPKPSASIPWSDVAAKAGADYHGDGLSVMAAANGARLRCGGTLAASGLTGQM